MRAFLVILCLFAIGVVVAGSVLGWFAFATARTEQDRADPLTRERAGATTDRDAGSGWLEFPSSPLEHEKDPTAATPAAQQDRTQFLQRAESRFKALESRVGDLQAKAKHGRAVTREKMNETLDDLARKTASARLEMRELRNATDARWDVLKTRLGRSLDALEDVCEKAFARFMNEDARSERAPILMAALRIGRP